MFHERMRNDMLLTVNQINKSVDGVSVLTDVAFGIEDREKLLLSESMEPERRSFA